MVEQEIKVLHEDNRKLWEEVKKLREDTDREFKAVRQDMKELREDMNREFKTVRQEMNNKFLEIQKQSNKHLALIVTTVGVCTTLLAVVIQFF